MCQSLSGIKNRQFDFVLVEEIQPMIRFGPVAATGPTASLAQRAQVTVHRESGPKGITLVPFEVFIGRADKLAEFAVELHHMSVGVDNSILSHGLPLVWICLAIGHLVITIVRGIISRGHSTVNGCEFQ